MDTVTRSKNVNEIRARTKRLIHVSDAYLLEVGNVNDTALTFADN